MLILIASIVLILTGADVSMAATTYSVKAHTITVDGSRFDVRIAAKERTWGYDTIQGACSYDGYAYLSLYNRQKEKIKIAKVDLNTMKVVKKSGALGCRCHGDSLTYNPDKNIIVVNRGKGSRKSVAVVNATTLKLKYTKKIKVSRKMAGGTYRGIAGIAWNADKKIYVAKLRSSSNNVLHLDSSFRPIKRVKVQGNRSYLLAQSIYSEGNFMYDIQSFKGKHKYNLITVRNVSSGKLLGRMKIKSGTRGQLYELENLFHEGDQWYISFYRAKVRKSGDRYRKNYLCKITVPEKLQPSMPQPVVDEPEITDEPMVEDNNPEIIENLDESQNNQDSGENGQFDNPQIIESENEIQ